MTRHLDAPDNGRRRRSQEGFRPAPAVPERTCLTLYSSFSSISEGLGDVGLFGTMDSYRDDPDEFGLPAASGAPAAETPAPGDIAAAIGTDERRMHVRAYNYWVSLLGGRDFPSIEDLEPASLGDFAPNSVLLDFTGGHENPATQFIGAAIREECGLDANVRGIADIPSRSLLSRLTDHYMQIIANRAPVGFEAEFVNHRGEPICYRGILMPFSSDGETIDFIYGVINWKAAEGQAAPGFSAPAVAEISAAPAAVELPQVAVIDEADLGAEAIDDRAKAASEDFSETASAEERAEELVPAGPVEIDFPEIRLDMGAGLADWLCAAREIAAEVKEADGRSRSALYKALARAHDFAVAAERDPAEYGELLEESGVKAQARAPMTPIVKLVFGVDYDKTRLTEFAAALSYAQRYAVPAGGFEALIESQPGGLKGLVAAERQARRPQTGPDTRAEAARARLRRAADLDLRKLSGDEEFCLVLTRRGADGVHRPVAQVADPALLDRAIRRTA